MSEVIWRAHPVYVNYEASSDGEIRNRRSGRILKTGTRRRNDGRYLHVGIHGHTVRVHTFVCETFHGLKPSPELEARHLNDFPQDNRPQNLTWGTRADNLDDMKRNRYWGPRDLYHRFHAGETLTWQDALDDDSDWEHFPIEPADNERLRQMLRPTA